MPTGARENLWADGPNREPEVASAVVVLVVSIRIEVEVAGVVVVPYVERTRPEVAPATGIAEYGTFAVAGGRQEDGVAVLFALHFVAFHAVLRGPRPGAVVSQFLNFVYGRQRCTW